ncbi:MerR family transcriptional regulator [Sphaerisporangium aureirubrum]|uniref:MerR family transcriptional regulator n=1 Tax=Sphaerisporangium aureirubrum TaxID=1544736 RepID=A0ABW1NFN8_9ACTN
MGEPSGDQPDEGPNYGIGAVARRLGVPAPTLRTWNLRYGIGPSHRSPGGHRRYAPADLRRLEEMNRLIKAGLPPAEAAHAALRAGTVLEPPPAAVALAPPVALPETRMPTVASLTRAAMNLDADTISRTVDAALAARGVAWTWDHLVLPAFDAISHRQEFTGAGIEIEHLFTERILAAFSPLTGRPATLAHPRMILLACAEEEQHTLPSYALAAALTSAHHLETRLLGPRTPYRSLSDAIRRLAPATVFIWSQQRSTGDPTPLRTLPLLRPPTRVITGGPGWHLQALPPAIGHAVSLTDAITKIRSTLV